MKILVTGASGFIGGAFLRRFAGREALQLFGAGRGERPGLPAEVNWRALSLADLEKWDVTPDVVIHAAGRASPWGSERDYYRDNVGTTEQVLDFCRRRGYPRFIFLSTAAVYYRYAHRFGLGENTPLSEPFTSHYGRSKFLAEQRVASYEGEKTILRPCAVFGPGDRLLFPPLLKAAEKNQLWRLYSQGGPAQSELMHVDTLCDYLLLAASRKNIQSCYNLSSAQPVDVDALMQEVLQTLGMPPVRGTLNLRTALAFSGALEWIWRCLILRGEPPVTRFGVAVFGYSATLDVTRMLSDFGPPAIPLAQSLQTFLQQEKRQG